MNEVVPGIRRLCIAVAADRSLGGILDEACLAADVQCAHWFARPEGDEFAVFPPGIDEVRVVGDLVRGLRLTVGRMNAGAAARTRLRVALHQGITRCDERGFGGRAVEKACGLRDADIVERELAEHPHADFALIISAELFDDVVGDDGAEGLDLTAFRQVVVPGSGFLAWVSMSAALPLPLTFPAVAGPR
ncbi:hypothetical protein CcI49_00210 [Frankia sp. CcI49]|uniref:Uncharacterized protein n=1 Tax=Parafrankia irregularis TaxID=795642 RepID=A0A0S4QWT3_9ACTN|nr:MULTISPECIES: hypothetical protein [Frankiaceae]KPM56641.1 hypothetical protein ACG83_01685 [Frankia sp. R43]MBE3202419.1 hypothetical protein [Parafrankia sp. CH37]ONH62533.1 hypothetical protein CcI49_00210 [Frankia sp. CcI49]CUU58934.1 hypothetical protein Ga0074812_12362 [Parafrankia irregularis]